LTQKAHDDMVGVTGTSPTTPGIIDWWIGGGQANTFFLSPLAQLLLRCQPGMMTEESDSMTKRQADVLGKQERQVVRVEHRAITARVTPRETTSRRYPPL